MYNSNLIYKIIFCDHSSAYEHHSFILVIKPTDTISLVFSCSIVVFFSLCIFWTALLQLSSVVFSFNFAGFWVSGLVSFDTLVLLRSQHGIRADVNLSLPISLLVRVFFLVVHAGVLCDQSLAYGRISKSWSFGVVFHGTIVG
jgi:hypothetical protein